MYLSQNTHYIFVLRNLKCKFILYIWISAVADNWVHYTAKDPIRAESAKPTNELIKRYFFSKGFLWLWIFIGSLWKESLDGCLRWILHIFKEISREYLGSTKKTGINLCPWYFLKNLSYISAPIQAATMK